MQVVWPCTTSLIGTWYSYPLPYIILWFMYNQDYCSYLEWNMYAFIVKSYLSLNMFGSSLLPIICVCLRIVVSGTCCVVYLFVCFHLVYLMLSVSLDCPFFIAPLVFSNAYLTYLFVNNTCAKHAGANTALKANDKMCH